MLKIKKCLLCLVAFSFLFFGCTDTDSQPGKSACGNLASRPEGSLTRIIDGTDCSVLRSPVAQITLLTESGLVGICSGTVIHPRFILTAAHCYLESAEGPIIDSSVLVEGVDFFVKSVSIHPNANLTQNDVAIVELVSSVAVTPVPLLISEPVRTDDSVSIFGYGFDEEDNFASLKSGRMKITGVTAQNVFARFSKSSSNICFGDSGGPALMEGEEGELGIIGVTSFATNDGCLEDSFAAFANVQGNEILEFILDVVPSVDTL